MRFVCLSISGRYYDTWRTSFNDLFQDSGLKNNFCLDSFVILANKIISDDHLDTVVIHYKENFTPGFFTALEEIADLIGQMKRKGKKIYFFAKSYNLNAFYLGSCCTKTFIHEAGMLNITGFAITEYYLRELMEKYNIDVDVVSTGAGKSLFDTFTKARMDENQKNVYNIIIQQYYNCFLSTVAENKHKPKGEVAQLFDGRILTAKEAISAGWIDETGSFNKIIEDLRKTHKYKKIKFKVLQENRIRMGHGKIGVLFIEGMIVEGKAKLGPWGKQLTEEQVIKGLNLVSKDKKIKGLIIRINSGGGSVIASRNIFRAIEAVSKRIPVIVSMGSIAASGGYWIALKGRLIMANSTTTTGSVGVISGKLVLDNFLKNYGINHSTVKIGESAEPVFLRHYTEKEIEYINHYLNELRELFIIDLQSNRKIKPASLDLIQSGNLFTAAEALEMGLVDKIGSLSVAIEEMKKIVGIKHATIEFYPQYKRNWLHRFLARKISHYIVRNNLQGACALTTFCPVFNVFFDESVNAMAIPLSLTMGTGGEDKWI